MLNQTDNTIEAARHAILEVCDVILSELDSVPDPRPLQLAVSALHAAFDALSLAKQAEK